MAKVECKECGQLCKPWPGGLYMCWTEGCERVATPVNEYGYTPEEHEDALESQRNRQAESEAERFMMHGRL
jgi:hypothetical protein